MNIRTWRNNEKRASFLQRTAKEIRTYKMQKRLLLAVVAMLLTLTLILYIIAVLYKKEGSFTVSLDKHDRLEYGLTLCDTKGMERPTSQLSAQIAEHMTNISGEDIPETVGRVDGEHNGDNYIAFTFYVQNGGETEFNYEYDVVMKNVTNDLNKAIRLRFYVDDVPTTYAYVASDGKPEPGTEKFHSHNIMVHGRRDDFTPGSQSKFTIVLWIEGNDPECTDKLIGGSIKIDMEISVVH